MTLQRSIPIAWRPLGISDAIDASMAREGTMQVLANLIPDPSTLGNWLCRPASTLLVDFNAPGSGPFSSGFSSGFQQGFLSGGSGQIVAFEIFGNRVYGWISGPSNFDYPFVFDLLTKQLQVISGGTNTAFLPATQPTVGAWTPPTFALVGTKLIMTHPGYSGSNFFGVIDTTNPNALTYTAGNMQGGSAITFAVPPSAVANFNGRAYYALNPINGQPTLVFSDVLVPLNATNANQILTFDDRTALTALAPLPLQNQVSGGVVQALMVFKSTAQVYQVTGDAALNNLAKNALNLATGTLSPLAIAVTPKGVGFVAPDGFRIIDWYARISDPVGWDGQGKTTPFIFQGVPSRACAAATGTMYRVTVQDTTLINSPFVEYWYDTVRGQWSGPHQFANTQAPNAIGAFNNTFITSIRGVPAKLWQSDAVVSSGSMFVENGTQLNFGYMTTMLPDTDQMSENSMIETTITMGLDINVSYPCQFLDPNGQVLGSATVFSPATATTPLWGTAIWGQFTWGAPPVALFPRQVAWLAPVVFRLGQFQITGPSSKNVKLSTLHCRYEMLGYIQQGVAA